MLVKLTSTFMFELEPYEQLIIFSPINEPVLYIVTNIKIQYSQIR